MRSFEVLRFSREIKTFEARLSLALARCFLTSTRFELNRGFARDMSSNAGQLMARIIDHQGNPWETFEFPREILLYN